MAGPASTTVGRNSGASGTGGAVCGAVGFGHEDVDDDAAADGAIGSWTAGAGCPPPSWTGPDVGWVGQVAQALGAGVF